MLSLDLPSGSHIDFDTIEGLAQALKKIREGKPIVIRSDKDGVPEVLWAPEDERQ